MIDNTLNNLISLVKNYECLGHSFFGDQFEKNLRHIAYDTIFEKAGCLLIENKGMEFFSSLKKIVNDSISDITFPREKSEILLRLYFNGCFSLYYQEISSVNLDEFVETYQHILKQWHIEVINDIYEDAREREKQASLFGDHFILCPLNERLQDNQDVFKAFFEYISTKSSNLIVNYERGIKQLSISNSKVLFKHYGINF